MNNLSISKSSPATVVASTGSIIIPPEAESVNPFTSILNIEYLSSVGIR